MAVRPRAAIVWNEQAQRTRGNTRRTRSSLRGWRTVFGRAWPSCRRESDRVRSPNPRRSRVTPPPTKHALDQGQAPFLRLDVTSLQQGGPPGRPEPTPVFGHGQGSGTFWSLLAGAVSHLSKSAGGGFLFLRSSRALSLSASTAEPAYIIAYACPGLSFRFRSQDGKLLLAPAPCSGQVKRGAKPRRGGGNKEILDHVGVQPGQSTFKVGPVLRAAGRPMVVGPGTTYAGPFWRGAPPPAETRSTVGWYGRRSPSRSAWLLVVRGHSSSQWTAGISPPSCPGASPGCSRCTLGESSSRPGVDELL